MKILYIIIAFLLLSSTVLLYNRNEKLKKDYQFQNEHFTEIKKNFLLHIFNRSFYTIPEKIAINNENLNTVNLRSIVGNRPKIVFRMTDQACGKCINECINFINSFPIESQHDFIFLVSSKNPNYLIVLHETLSKSISLYRIDYEVLENPFEISDTPYFFIITSDLNMKYFHVLDTNNLNITKEYIEEIKSNILNVVS